MMTHQCNLGQVNIVCHVYKHRVMYNIELTGYIEKFLEVELMGPSRMYRW